MPMIDISLPPPAIEAPAVAPVANRELTVLTYNIRGLPWPIARHRGRALKEIGRELAEMRREGRQPDIVLLQEGFRGEVADLVRESGYRYWAHGPKRGQKAHDVKPQDGQGYRRAAYPTLGEGWGKFTSGGLHVLSDSPIEDVARLPYRYCAGFDCLANKGVMRVRVRLSGAPFDVDVVNTHLNSGKRSGAPLGRANKAHNLQMDELLAFLADGARERPLLVGGDFNVRKSPERYYFRAEARPYVVVSEFCQRAADGCGTPAAAEAGTPWLRSQDLQAFASPANIEVRPISIATVFATGRHGLSDHSGYLVRYRLSWKANPATDAAEP